jgi:hypothetical protein
MSKRQQFKPTEVKNITPTYDQNDMDIYNSPILISDATSMFRRQIKPNTPPYTETILRKNNKKVDAWEKDMLNEVCDSDGKIPAGRIQVLLKLYEEGMSYKSFLDRFPYIPRPTEEQLEYWKNFLDRPMEELYDDGPELCLLGWQIVCNELKLRDTIKKYEEVYSKSNDPTEWYDLSLKNRPLFDGSYHSFWDEDKIKDISQRIQTIVSLRIQPSK